MAITGGDTDEQIGYTLLLGLAALAGAAAMFAAPGQQAKAWGFALAMVAATLTVLAAQAFA